MGIFRNLINKNIHNYEKGIFVKNDLLEYKFINEKENDIDHVINKLDGLLTGEEKACVLIFISRFFKIRFLNLFINLLLTPGRRVEITYMHNLFSEISYQVATDPKLASMILPSDKFINGYKRLNDVFTVWEHSIKDNLYKKYRTKNIVFILIDFLTKKYMNLSFQKYIEGLFEKSNSKRLNLFKESLLATEKVLNFYISKNLKQIKQLDSLDESINFCSIIDFINNNNNIEIIKNEKSYLENYVVVNDVENMYLIELPAVDLFFKAKSDFSTEYSKALEDYNKDPLRYINDNMSVIDKSSNIVFIKTYIDTLRTFYNQTNISLKTIEFLSQVSLGLSFGITLDWFVNDVLKQEKVLSRTIVSGVSALFSYFITKLLLRSNDKKK